MKFSSVSKHLLEERPMSWVDDLVPPELDENLVLKALDALAFFDESDAVNPGPLDMAALSLVYQMLTRPDMNLALQLPRGDHDFAIFCGLFAQLTRILAKARPSAFPPGTAFAGPVIVIGMNTMVQDRLRKIRIANVSLADGLTACRVRSDGRVVDVDGRISRLRSDDERILYLNTRVGWPQLNQLSFVGLVVIDRTSFASHDILDRALAWAEAQKAQRILVLSDLGDDETVRTLTLSKRMYVVWPWARPLIDELVYECGRGVDSHSALSTNPLLWQDAEGVKIAACHAPAVDELFRSAFASLIMAPRLDAQPPRPFVIARRLFFSLSRCVGTLGSFNEWAALDHRTSSMRSLRLDLEDSRSAAFVGRWSEFGATRWAGLRHDLLSLYDLIEAENPKLYGLAFTLEQLRSERDCEIIVRVPSEVSGFALVSDLIDLGIEIDRESGAIRWATFGTRHPWASDSRIDLYPGWLPASRLAALWSGESSLRLNLCYPFEQDLLRRSLGRGHRAQTASLASAFSALALGSTPADWPELADVSLSFKPDARPPTGAEVIQLDVDSGLLVGEIAESEVEDGLVLDGDERVDGGEVFAQGIVLEPGNETWWIREGGDIEVLADDRHSWRRVSQLEEGDQVIVPRGEGREQLFARVVEATHNREDLRAFDVFFGRWRRACWKVYEDCDQNWGTVTSRMRQAGSTVGWQTFRNWAEGRTIAPEDAEDIARIGRVAGDRLVEHEARRLDAMARQIRGLHVRLGHLLSTAMAEAMGDGGQNLSALSKLLGGMDATELLDEFEIRVVREVGPLEEIRSSQIGRLTQAVAPVGVS
jgi:hypothetical protein